MLLSPEVVAEVNCHHEAAPLVFPRITNHINSSKFHNTFMPSIFGSRIFRSQSSFRPFWQNFCQLSLSLSPQQHAARCKRHQTNSPDTTIVTSSCHTYAGSKQKQSAFLHIEEVCPSVFLSKELTWLLLFWNTAKGENYDPPSGSCVSEWAPHAKCLVRLVSQILSTEFIFDLDK